MKKLGSLEFTDILQHMELVASPVAQAITDHTYGGVYGVKTNAELADTDNFCKAYDVRLEESANCVVVKAKRAQRVWYIALMILATDRADVNKAVKKHIDARKISFAPMSEAVELTGMEYGGITPIGLPDDWVILVDARVAEAPNLVIGSGIRGSKLLVDGAFLSALPNAEVIDMAL